MLVIRGAVSIPPARLNPMRQLTFKPLDCDLTPLTTLAVEGH
jgi:hypothetical protein